MPAHPHLHGDPFLRLISKTLNPETLNKKTNMAISLESIKQNTIGPPRIVVYGTPGIGKTTFAASASKPIFIQTEDGLGTLDVPTFPKANSYRDVIDALGALIEVDNDYETVVVDSLDALEPMLWAHVCEEAGKKSIEDFGYGKGYVAAAAEWRALLQCFDELRNQGKVIVLIAHSTVVRFESPDADSYDRYQMRLDKRAEAVVSDWADALFFANYRVTTISAGGERKRGVGKGDRTLFTTERPAWRAKNRYRMPDELALDWDVVEQAMAPQTAAAV